MIKLDSILKSRGIIPRTKVHTVKAMVFPVVIYTCELNHKEGWTQKNWCFWTVVLKKILKSPLDSKVIKPINPKENQPSIFTGKMDAEATILWPPDAKSWLIGKDPVAGKDWGQKKEAREDEVTGWINHWLSSDLIKWTWDWANSRRQWRTGKLGMLQFVGSQRQKRLSDWTTNHLYVEFKIWHKWTYLWSRNRLTDIQNKHRVSKGEHGSGREGLGVWG